MQRCVESWSLGARNLFLGMWQALTQWGGGGGEPGVAGGCAGCARLCQSWPLNCKHPQVTSQTLLQDAALFEGVPVGRGPSSQCAGGSDFHAGMNEMGNWGGGGGGGVCSKNHFGPRHLHHHGCIGWKLGVKKIRERAVVNDEEAESGEPVKSYMESCSSQAPDHARGDSEHVLCRHKPKVKGCMDHRRTQAPKAWTGSGLVEDSK